MRMRLLAFVLFCVWGIVDGVAAPVSREQAARAAQNFVSRAPAGGPMKAKMGGRLRQTRAFNRGKLDTPLFYVVAMEGGGFVVTSADTRITPVIAFSEGDDLIESAENPLWVMLNLDLAGRMDALDAEAVSPALATMTAGAMQEGRQTPEAQWASLLSMFAPMGMNLTGDDDVRVPPMVQSAWDQSTVGDKNVYNYYTPNNHLAGCVAIAGAQIMRYHRKPSHFVPARTSACWIDGTAFTLTMKGGIYDWDNMPLKPDASITPAGQEAIGRICYDAGLAARMQYSATFSGAYVFQFIDNMRVFFDYASGFTYRCSTSSPASNANIRNAMLGSLDAGMPVMLSIAGNGAHAILTDGYGFSNGEMYAHMNMGWSGRDDAWYSLQIFDVSMMGFNVLSNVGFNISPDMPGEWITGRTLDNFGAVIPNVTVRVRNTSGGETYSAVSNARGVYAARVPSADATYAVSASVGARISATTTIRINPSVTAGYWWSGAVTYYSSYGQVGNSWGNELVVPPESLAAPVVTATTDLTDKTRVTWSVVPGAASYTLFRNTADNADGATPLATTTALQYDDITAPVGTLHFYWVRSSFGDTRSAFSAPASGGRAFAPPASVAAGSGAYTDKVRVVWSAVTGASTYKVFRSASNDSAGAVQIAASTNLQLDDTPPTPGVYHYYWVKASGNTDTLDSAFSASARGWQALTPPVVIAGNGTHTGKIPLTWTPAKGALSYKVYRNTVNSSSSSTLLATTGDVGYDDTAASPGITYCYWVKASTGTASFDSAYSVVARGRLRLLETLNSPRPVPCDWLDQHFPGNNGADAAYEELAMRLGANGYRVWESYVANLDPNNPRSKFTARIDMVNGKPVISHDPPDPGDGKRVCIILGNPTLDPGGWVETTSNPDNNLHFFKVQIDLK